MKKQAIKSRPILTRIIAFFAICITLVTIPAYAHNAMLDIDYDDCEGDANSDGINETWYCLDSSAYCYHLSHEVETIKYYFLNSDECSWTSYVSTEIAAEIQAAYARSMEKWNNVYFYSYGDDGNVVKHRVINVVEGTADDYNLLIYPTYNLPEPGETYTVASTYATISSAIVIEAAEAEGDIEHIHPTNWKMVVNVACFYENDYFSASEIAALRELTGAHELGHVLGLRDVDTNCSASTGSSSGWHHKEILMGYGDPITSRAQNITYKDIAGVAITRGFHTDDDHQWLNCGLQEDDTYKLNCSICNGVKYVDSLSGYTYSTYYACGGNHELSDGNMMAVASYGTSDYYKCKYCRYVAPFDSIVAQNYSLEPYSLIYHAYANNVEGLHYTLYLEQHSYLYHWLSYTAHSAICICGEYHTSAHTVSSDSVTGIDQYATCLLCGGQASVGYVTLDAVSDLPHSANGSYVLSNGVIVLVDEDIEAYMDGTLTFSTGDVA